MKRTTTLLAAGLLSCIWTQAATAAPIEIRYDGFANGSRNGYIHGTHRNAHVAAGQFDFDVTDPGTYWDSTLQAFCIDVATNLVTSGRVKYDFTTAGSSDYLNSDQLSLIGRLYDGFAGLLGTQDNDAAFQLALWEIVYDYGGSLLLNEGHFSATSFGTALTTAQNWLNGLGDVAYVGAYELFVLEPARGVSSQTLLTARTASVPEPGALGLLGAGLVAAGMARWRRRK